MSGRRWKVGEREETVRRLVGATVIWDFDGVIADSEPVQAESYRRLLRNMGNSVEPGFFVPYIGHPEPTIWEMMRADGFRLAGDPDDLRDERHDIFVELARARLKPSWLVRDLAATAEDLKARQVIVSNGNPEAIRAFLGHWDLTGILDLLPVHLAGGKAAVLRSLWAGGPTVTIEDNVHFTQAAREAGSWTVFVHHSMNTKDQYGDVEVWI